MLSSFVGWIMLSSSSSSSSSSLYNEDDDIDDDFYDIVSAEPDEEKHDAVVQRDAVVEDGYPIPVAIAVTDASAEVTVAAPGTMAPMCDYPNFTTTVVGKRKRRRIENDDDILSTQEEKKYLEKNPRRLSHRLWTNEDEIQLLQGFLEYKTRRGSRHQYNVNTALFYDEIKSKIQVGVNKNQLFDKLRRFKKKYLDVLDKISSVKKFSFKSAHDEATFEISRKIWGHIIPMSRLGDEDNALVEEHEQSVILDNLNLFNVKVESEEVAGDWRPRKRMKSLFGLRSNEKDIPNSVSTSNDKNNEIDDNIDTVDMIEETVRSCLSPLFKELLSNALGPMPSNIGGITSQSNNGEVGNEKWREQRILELEVYSKRLELVRDQMKATLEELRSREG